MADKTWKARERFWSKVVKRDGGCWEWTAATFRGYGQVSYEGKVRRAHRVSWEITHGRIPGDLCVLHRCDNRACVNPDHLWLGTRPENAADMVAKRRQARGNRHGRRKLSDSQVREIRQRVAGTTQRQLSREYGVSEAMVSLIVNGHNWNG